MSQYGVGSVKVLGADHNRWVLLGGVTSNGNIAVGNQVKFDAEPHLWFTVSALIDALTFDTVEDYSGTRPYDSYFPYVVTRDFTPNLVLPEMTQGDRNTADIYTRMVRRLDGVLGTQLVRLTNATGGVLVTGDVVTYATGTDKAVSLVTVSGSFQKLLVCLDATVANGGQGLFLTEGAALAKVTGAITRGHYIKASATSKTVEDTGTAMTVAAPPAGAAGIALTAPASGYATVALFSAPAGASGGGGGSGTVTSVAIATGSQEFSVMGSPITTAGTITIQRLAVNAIGDITGAVSYDWNNGATFSARLTGAVTLTLTNPQNGGVYRMLFVQDATGSRTLTILPTPLWPGPGTAVTINATALQRTQVELWYDGTSYHAQMNKTGSH